MDNLMNLGLTNCVTLTRQMRVPTRRDLPVPSLHQVNADEDWEFA